VLTITAMAWLASGEAAVAHEQFRRIDGRVAQFKSDTPIRVVPATPSQPVDTGQPAASPTQAALPNSGTVRSSSVGGLGFAVPATRASDDALVGIIRYVADRLNQTCSRIEAFAWPGVGLHAPEGLKVHMTINQALQIEGYSYVERELPAPQDQEMAKVEAKITAYSAETTDRNAKDRHIVAVWYRETDDLHLMLCPASPKPTPKED
jgi:hypothetical protein